MAPELGYSGSLRSLGRHGQELNLSMNDALWGGCPQLAKRAVLGAVREAEAGNEKATKSQAVTRDGSLQYKSIDNRRLYCLNVHELTTLTCCSLRLRDNSMCPARTGGIYQDARILKWMSGMHDWVSNCIDCDEIARARKMKKMRNLYGRWTRRRSLEGI